MSVSKILAALEAQAAALDGVDLPSPWVLASVAAAAISLTSVIRFLLSTRRPKDYPPGPPTLLGLGNLHQIPIKQPFLQFKEWKETYGDIIGLKVGPNHLVILNSPEHVRELFDKRGAVYSGRPYSYIPFEHVFCEHRDKHILGLQNTPFLRRWRTAVSYLVGPAGLKQSFPMQEATAAALMHNLLEADVSRSPEHFKHWALATPLLAITGQRLEDRGKGFSDRFFKGQHDWLELLEPGNAPPVDFVPFLRWIPERFAEWKTKARYVREYMVEEYASFFRTAEKLSLDEARGHIAEGGFRCLMAKIIGDRRSGEGNKEKEGPLTDDEIAYMGGGLLDAAVDTTWAAINSLVMFLAVNPEVQAKAREEVDRVSPDKPPGGEIIGELPYIHACIYETFRARPPAPNGLPHVLTRDDVYRGYRIPKDTTVLANVFGIHHDPTLFDQPYAFRPERFIEHPLGYKPGVEAGEGVRATYTFGAGRRICPGQQFAVNALMLTAAKLVWAYEIVAEGGIDTTLETGFGSGLVLTPRGFEVKFVLREGRREGVVGDFEGSRAVLEKIGI